MEPLITWTRASFIVRSPIVRAVALVPALGYLVLFGDHFAEFFSFSKQLESVDLWFSQGTRVRLLYYGAIILTLALVIHLVFCPEVCRRHSNISSAKDEHVRTGTASDLVNKFSFIRNGFDNPEKLSPLVRIALSILDDARRKIAASGLGGDANYRTVLPQDMLDRASELHWASGIDKETLGEQGLSVGQIADLLHAYAREKPMNMYMNAQTKSDVSFLAHIFLSGFYLSSFHSPEFRHSDLRIVTEVFNRSNALRPGIALSVFALSVIGAILLFLPAIDVFWGVLVGDLVSSGLFETIAVTPS